MYAKLIIEIQIHIRPTKFKLFQKVCQLSAEYYKHLMKMVWILGEHTQSPVPPDGIAGHDSLY